MGVTEAEFNDLQQKQLQKGKKSRYVAISRGSTRSAMSGRFQQQQYQNQQGFQNSNQDDPKIALSKVSELLGPNNPLSKKVSQDYESQGKNYMNQSQNSQQFSSTLSFKFKDTNNNNLVKQGHPSLYFKNNNHSQSFRQNYAQQQVKQRYMDNQQVGNNYALNKSSNSNQSKYSYNPARRMQMSQMSYRNDNHSTFNHPNRQTKNPSNHSNLTQETKNLYNSVFQNPKNKEQKQNNNQDNQDIDQKAQKEIQKGENEDLKQKQQQEQQTYTNQNENINTQQNYDPNPYTQANQDYLDQNHENNPNYNNQNNNNQEYFNGYCQPQPQSYSNISENLDGLGFNKSGRFTESEMIKFNSMLMKNEAYLKHLKGDCLCGRCICGKCRCPQMIFLYDQDKKQPTSYQADYTKQKPLEQNLPHIKMSHHDTAKPYGNMDLGTTNQDFFKKHPVSKSLPFKGKDQAQRDFPFSSSTVYGQQFINWGTYKALNMAPNIKQTIIPELKLVDNSIYKDSFNKEIPKQAYQKDPNSEFIKEWQKRPNIRNPKFDYMPETTNSQFYKEKKNKPERVNAPKAVYNPQPTYKGQFNSNQRLQFGNTLPMQCPSRLELAQMHKQQVQNNRQAALDYQRDIQRQIKTDKQQQQPVATKN